MTFNRKLLLLFTMNFLCSNSLKICGETNAAKIHICLLDKNYESSDTGSLPMQVRNSITLFSISEFNENDRVMTLNMLLSTVWNDTRLTLESSKGIK